MENRMGTFPAMRLGRGTRIRPQGCLEIDGQNAQNKAGSILRTMINQMGKHKGAAKRRLRPANPDGHASKFQGFFLVIPIFSEIPLKGLGGGPAGSFLAFLGFRTSRFPRFCSLAMIFSSPNGG